MAFKEFANLLKSETKIRTAEKTNNNGKPRKRKRGPIGDVLEIPNREVKTSSSFEGKHSGSTYVRSGNQWASRG